MERRLVETADGTSTLFVAELDEYFHSIHGALQESRHVFVQAGFGFAGLPATVRLLEWGWGTGLNALLTWAATEQAGRQVHYTGVERYPLSAKEWSTLNYAQHLSPVHAPKLAALHQAPWEEEVALAPRFSLTKREADFRSVHLPEGHYHLIYMDAFAPSAQPELWTPGMFDKLYHCLAPGGILVSYCVKGSVRRAAQEAGFETEKLPGPPGKREMLRAFKSP